MAFKKSEQAIPWQEHVDKLKASGMSRPAYCLEHGLKVHQLAYHFRRLGKGRASNKNVFARVVTAPAGMPVPSRVGARLMLGGGVALEIDSGVDPVWLARLVSHVGVRP